MRVLHVYRTYFPDSQGGLEEVIRQICLNTKPLGVQSRVLSLSQNPTAPAIRREEAIVYRPKLSLEVASCGISLSALGYFKRLAGWADIIHYHFPWPFADVLHFAARIKKPTVLTYHSDIVRQRFLGRLYRPLMHQFLKSVDHIVCTSENYFATSQVLTRYEDKLSIVPIGLNEASYPQVSEARVEQLREDFGENFFLFVGVLRYYKGLHILLDSIKDAPFKVVIVGSGPTEAELKQQAHRLQLDNVVFTGQLPELDKVALFRLSRAVVFPSYLRSEAFGVTLLEGAMYGRPLISTEVGSGTSHVNIHGETGLVVPPGSAKALREAMEQLCFHPDVASAMGSRARSRYEELFTGYLMGERYHQIYESTGQAAEAPVELRAIAGSD